MGTPKIFAWIAFLTGLCAILILLVGILWVDGALLNPGGTGINAMPTISERKAVSIDVTGLGNPAKPIS